MVHAAAAADDDDDEGVVYSVQPPGGCPDCIRTCGVDTSHHQGWAADRTLQTAEPDVINGRQTTVTNCTDRMGKRHGLVGAIKLRPVKDRTPYLSNIVRT